MLKHCYQKASVTHFTCQNFCSCTLLFILILASCSAFIAPSIVFRSINSPSNWYLIKLTEGSTIPACPHLSGGLFLVCEDLGRTLDNSFPASTFFFFKVVICLCTLIPLFRPRWGHGGSASWDDWDWEWEFPDELHVNSCFLIGSHTMPGQWHSQPTPTSLGQRCMCV